MSGLEYKSFSFFAPDFLDILNENPPVATV